MTIRALWDNGAPWEPEAPRVWGEAVSDRLDELDGVSGGSGGGIAVSWDDPHEEDPESAVLLWIDLEGRC